MNGLSVKTVIPGRNNVPGIYSSNFDPTANSTMGMLTRLAIGAILIQNADFDPVTCTETCTLKLWIKTCPADCDDSTWAPIPTGAPVLPPDKYCVSGSLTPGNVLTLTLSDGSTITVDLSPLAVDNDRYPTAMSLGAGNVLTMTLNDASTVTVNLSALAVDNDKFLVSMALGAGNILTGTLNDGSTVTVDLSALVPVVADGVTITGDGTAGNPLVAGNLANNGDGSYTWTDAAASFFRFNTRSTFGVSPFVINPTTGANNWANGAVESTPIATLTIAAEPYPRLVEAHLYHGAYARMSTFESPKANALSLYSLISFDNGSGVLQLASLNGNYMGINQIIVQAVASDIGQAAGAAGNEPQMIGICYIPLAAGASITLRAQSTLTIQDGANASIAWTFCQIAATVLPVN